MKPMLAKKFQDQGHNLTYPLFVQPKLNGIRAIYNQNQFQSRDEHFYNAPTVAHLAQELIDVPANIILDGEFYVHGWPLQKINGAISVNRLLPTATTASVQYHVFDCIDANNITLPFSERHALLSRLCSIHSALRVHLVDTHEVHSPAEADHFFSTFKSLDYEGMMYRDNVPYGILDYCTNKENRWPILLKRKDWLDEDCEILDVNLGEGKYSECVGSLTLRFPNGQVFRAGSGLSDMQRHTYMDSPPIGLFAKIKYEMLSSGSVPLKPTIEAILD